MIRQEIFIKFKCCFLAIVIKGKVWEKSETKDLNKLFSLEMKFSKNHTVPLIVIHSHIGYIVPPPRYVLKDLYRIL